MEEFNSSWFHSLNLLEGCSGKSSEFFSGAYLLFALASYTRTRIGFLSPSYLERTVCKASWVNVNQNGFFFLYGYMYIISTTNRTLHLGWVMWVGTHRTSGKMSNGSLGSKSVPTVNTALLAPFRPSYTYMHDMHIYRINHGPINAICIID